MTTRTLALALALALPAAAVTTITDNNVTTGTGAPFSGTITISWPYFVLQSTGQSIPAGRRILIVTGGHLTVQLQPYAAYTVAYAPTGGGPSTHETWNVPDATNTLAISQVRTSSPPSGGGGGYMYVGGPIDMSNVTGLAAALSNRPVIGPGYSASHAAVINTSGELEAAVGTASNCVHADGTTGVCGPQGATGPQGPQGATGATGGYSLIQGDGFNGAETPAGAIDGANVTFTFTHAPNPATSLMLTRNGIVQQPNGIDYSLAGSTVTFSSPNAIPQTGDTLLAWYRNGAALSMPVLGGGSALASVPPYSGWTQGQCAVFASDGSLTSSVSVTTVGTLPACGSATLRQRRYVSDATSATPGAAAAGSGTYSIAVQCIFNSAGAVYGWIID